MSAIAPGEDERDRDEQPCPGPYDSELGFLFALEREVTRRAVAAHETRARADAFAGAPVATADPLHRRGSPRPAAGPRQRERARAGVSRRRGALRPALERMARRSLTLVALLCLIGASAYGAGRILKASAPNPANLRRSALVPVASGRSGPDSWSLRLYLRGSELCRVLVVADGESSRCSPPPGPNGVAVASVVSPTRRYLYGVTGAGVAHVSVRAGEEARTVATRATTPASPSTRILPAGVRWFLAVLRRPTGEPDPRARVRGLDRGGRSVGPALSDCAEAPESLSCGS